MCPHQPHALQLTAPAVTQPTPSPATPSKGGASAWMSGGDAPAGRRVLPLERPSRRATAPARREARRAGGHPAPLTSLALTQPSGVPAWQTIPSWAVIGTADHAIPPTELLAMADQATRTSPWLPAPRTCP